MIVKIKTESGILPEYQTEGSAGFDIRAHLDEGFVLGPGERALVPTGLYIAVPSGYEAQVRARSGLAIKHGIGLVNGIGTVDSDYRGEILVPLINWSNEAYEIKDGERIAQIVINKYEQAELVKVEKVEDLGETNRGSGGFGHTGKE